MHLVVKLLVSVWSFCSRQKKRQIHTASVGVCTPPPPSRAARPIRTMDCGLSYGSTSQMDASGSATSSATSRQVTFHVHQIRYPKKKPGDMAWLFRTFELDRGSVLPKGAAYEAYVDHRSSLNKKCVPNCVFGRWLCNGESIPPSLSPA